MYYLSIGDTYLIIYNIYKLFITNIICDDIEQLSPISPDNLLLIFVININ